MNYRIPRTATPRGITTSLCILALHGQPHLISLYPLYLCKFCASRSTTNENSYIIMSDLQLHVFTKCCINESTAGADASVKSLKLRIPHEATYLLTLAYLALLYRY